MKFSLFLTLLLIGSFFIALSSGHKHTCVHNKISKNFKPVKAEILSEEEKGQRILQYTTTRPIKILIDESNMKVSAQERDLIVGKLVPVATEFLKNRLTVLTRGSLLRVPLKQCYEAIVPSAHQTQGVDADLVIYVTATNEPNESFIAWATSCLEDSVTGRPIAGQINFNIAYLSYEADQFEEQVDTTLHEITHILAFSDNLYPLFTKSFLSHELVGESNVWQSGVFIRGGSRNVIKSPKVLEVARTYFGCPTISGVELENEGGDGSAGAHWERTILHNEQMTASSIPQASFSEFTLALLHDSGWYQVDFSKAEPMFFGQGAGCNFVNQGCSGSLPGRREFCSSSTAQCTFNYKMKGFCSDENFSDGCKYVMGYSNANCENPAHASGDYQGEVYGTGSRCVIGSIIDRRYSNVEDSPLCLKYTCPSAGVVKFLPKAGGEIVCTKAGERVSATGTYQGQIVCPDPVEFCKDFYRECPNSCTSKGYCVKGVCECRAGFGGADCSVAGGSSAPTPVDPCASVKCPINGSCSNGVCRCNVGFQGPNCERIPPPCPNKCSDRGTCNNGVCSCLNGFSGSSCQTASSGFSGSCPDMCFTTLGKGSCVGTQKTSFFFFKSTSYACRCNAGSIPPNCQ